MEHDLKLALHRQKHVVIHGESGTGKSWLWKKVLADLGAKYMVANFANASRWGGLAAALQNQIDRREQAMKTGFVEEKRAGLSAAVAKSEVSHKGEFSYGKMEPFESCLKYLRGKANKGLAVLVLENLEAVFEDAKLLKELANILLLCDDDTYAEYNVRIVIVGATSNLKDYYYATPNPSTIVNRLYEIPEVSRLPYAAASSLLRTGLIELLGYHVEERKHMVPEDPPSPHMVPEGPPPYRESFRMRPQDLHGLTEEPAEEEMDNLTKIIDHAIWITDGVPQALHEYGLELALLAEEADYLLTADDLRTADSAWLKASHFQAYCVVESHMNRTNTKIGRRNQTLLVLSQENGEQFKAADIEAHLKRMFPESTRDAKLNVGAILAQLANGTHPVLRRSPKGDAYCFAKPQYRMVLRTMLVATAGGRVEKRSLFR